MQFMEMYIDEYRFRDVDQMDDKKPLNGSPRIIDLKDAYNDTDN